MNIKCEQTWLKYAFDLDVQFFVETTSEITNVIFFDLLLSYQNYNKCSRFMNVTSKILIEIFWKSFWRKILLVFLINQAKYSSYA